MHESLRGVIKEQQARITELEANLEKARETIKFWDEHSPALALLDSPNVIAQIKAEVIRELAESDNEGTEKYQILCYADNLLNESKHETLR